MPDVLSIALQGMQGDLNRVRQISLNLANGITTAFKRSIVTQAPVRGIGANFAAHFAIASSHTALGLNPLAQAPITYHSDSAGGALKSTGQPLDMALIGDGFFEVMTERGLAYTRQGNFQTDRAGRLVTAQGFPVMGEVGEIFLTIANPSITSTGAILDPKGRPETPLGQLKLVQFEAEFALENLGDGLLSAGTPLKALQVKRPQVRQGYLENSNVVASREMTDLIQTMRHFETMQKITTTYDEMMGAAIRKLGDAP